MGFTLKMLAVAFGLIAFVLYLDTPDAGPEKDTTTICKDEHSFILKEVARIKLLLDDERGRERQGYITKEEAAASARNLDEQINDTNVRLVRWQAKCG